MTSLSRLLRGSLLFFGALGTTQASLVVIPQTISPGGRFAFAKLPAYRLSSGQEIVPATLVRLPSETPVGQSFSSSTVYYDLTWKRTGNFLSSVWNRRETRVAVNCLNKRGGDIEVYRRTKAGLERFEMPDLQEVAIRETQGAEHVSRLFLKATRWIDGVTLEVKIDGTAVMKEQASGPGSVGYAFALRIEFAGHGKGRVIDVKRTKLPDAE